MVVVIVVVVVVVVVVVAIEQCFLCVPRTLNYDLFSRFDAPRVWSHAVPEPDQHITFGYIVVVVLRVTYCFGAVVLTF